MKKNSKFSLISGLIFFIFGIIIFTNPDVFVKAISYVIGGILILTGLYKTFNYYIHDKNLGVVNRNEIAFGITAIILGIIFIFLASAIELVLRFIVGGYLILMGIGKIFNTFYMYDRTSKFYALIVLGLLLIFGGSYTIAVADLPLKIIGLFLAIYGVIDFISYFIYRDNAEVKAEADDIKESKLISSVKEADNIEEAKFVEKKTKKGKKKKELSEE